MVSKDTIALAVRPVGASASVAVEKSLPLAESRKIQESCGRPPSATQVVGPIADAWREVLGSRSCARLGGPRRLRGGSVLSCSSTLRSSRTAWRLPPRGVSLSYVYVGVFARQVLERVPERFVQRQPSREFVTDRSASLCGRVSSPDADIGGCAKLARATGWLLTKA